jgi:hypothetical protein
MWHGIAGRRQHHSHPAALPALPPVQWTLNNKLQGVDCAFSAHAWGGMPSKTNMT